MRAMTRAAERVLALALAEVGYLEKASNAQLDSPTANAGSGNYTKYARDLDAVEGLFNGRKQGAAWCAVFAIWPFVRAFGAELAMRMLYLPAKSLGAGVKYLAQYFQRAGRFFKTGPQPGDLIFFYKKDLTSWAHVGLVERTDGERVYTVEGNASGASGVTPNGGGVVRKGYALTYDRIAGYGRPDWPAAEEGEEEDMLTGKEIVERINEYTAALPVPDWAEGELREAVEMGITDGSDPTGLIPRYQAAIMALRAAKAEVRP